MRLLVVEDDRLLNGTLCYHLATLGFKVDSALSKREAASLYKKQDYDLMILDVGLPDGNGFELCQEIRMFRPDVMVIFLTANDLESDMLKGYELGADDYVTKPFSIRVFKKKILALLSRVQKASKGDCYQNGHLYISFDEMVSTLNGEPITFTAMEYRMLKILIRNSGKVLTRQILLERLWDADKNYVDEHALTVMISRIRGKLEGNGQPYIKTVYGMGYMWVGDDEE